MNSRVPGFHHCVHIPALAFICCVSAGSYLDSHCLCCHICKMELLVLISRGTVFIKFNNPCRAFSTLPETINAKCVFFSITFCSVSPLLVGHAYSSLLNFVGTSVCMLGPAQTVHFPSVSLCVQVLHILLTMSSRTDPSLMDTGKNISSAALSVNWRSQYLSHEVLCSLNSIMQGIQHTA